MTYSCRNKPVANLTYPAQDGWFYDESGMTRKPKIIEVRHAFDDSCKYDRSATDPGCTGCSRVNGGGE